MVGFVHGEECRYRDFGFLKDVKMVRFSSIPPRVLPLLATAARGPPVPGGAGPLLPRWRALPAQVVLLILRAWVDTVFTLCSHCFTLKSLFLNSSVLLSDAN